MDYARLVRLPEGAQTLVIGNPLVADVNMVKGNQLLVITGKSFGTTNLIVLDRAGQQVGEFDGHGCPGRRQSPRAARE